MAQIEVASGRASAHDASVLIGHYSSSELEAALAAARERETAEEPARRVAAATVKVEKFKAHLAEAERALAEAITAAQEGTV